MKVFSAKVCVGAIMLALLCVLTVEGASIRTGVQVVDRSLPVNRGSLRITGSLPIITGLSNNSFQSEVNALIMDEYTDRVASAINDGARALHFAYEAKFDGQYISIVMKTSTTSVVTKDEIRTFVFGLGNRLLLVNDVLGINGTKIVDKVIAREMAAHPGIYNPDFVGIPDNQSFYVQDGRLNVIFDKYAIGPGSLGTPVFGVNIALARRNTFSIASDEYFQQQPYNVRMIPLRLVSSRLGFDVEWNAAARSVIISRDDIQASVFLDRNNYLGSRGTSLALETAPELLDGVTYVPISFFDRVLDVRYTVSDTRITFSYYPRDEAL